MQCQFAFELTFNPAYRCLQFFLFFISFTASLFLIRLIFQRLFRLHFQKNLKFLLIGYFGAILFGALSFTIIFGHHSFQPWFALSSCDLILSKKIFKYGHYLVGFALSFPMFFPILISIERFVALKMIHRYETFPTSLGPIFIIIGIILNVFVLARAYQNESFDDQVTSFLLIPSSSSKNVNNLFLQVVVFVFISFSVNWLLLSSSLKLKKKIRLSGNLALRYEVEEVIFTTKFTTSIIFVHLLFTLIYLVATLFLRIFSEQLFTTEISYTVVRGLFFTIPIYSLVISFIANCLLSKLNATQAENIKTMMEIKSSGFEGAKNYDEIINNIWSQNTNISNHRY